MSSHASPPLGNGLEGETVIVTGAAGGIGGSIARMLAECGARVCAVDLPGDRLDAAVASLPGRADHWALGLDLADTTAVEVAVRDAAEHAGGLWGVVHAAALLHRQPVDEITAETWDAQHDVNLRGTFFLSRAVGQVLTKQGRGGRIVLFSSVAWLTGPILDSDAYVASKAGVVALSRGFARRYGPYGVTVNVIAPGQINTAMQASGNTEATMARTSDACPLGRMGTPDEVASVAVFLLSRHASFVSGATINVSGALVMY